MQHDLDMVKRAVQGDAVAFETLMYMEEKTLYYKAYSYVKNKEDALDAIQDATCKAYLSIKQLKQPEFFSTWLFRILIRECLAILKKSNRHIPYEESQLLYKLDQMQEQEIETGRIVIGFTIQSEQPINEDALPSVSYTFNGEGPEYMAGGYKMSTISDKEISIIHDFHVDRTLSQSFELGIIFEGDEGEQISFTSFIEQVEMIKRIELNEKESMDGIQLSIKELVLSETNLLISYELSEEVMGDGVPRGVFIDWIVMQNNQELFVQSTSQKSEEQNGELVTTGSASFEPTDKHVNELTITPYINMPQTIGSIEYKEGGEIVESTIEINESSIEFSPIHVNLYQLPRR